MDPSKRTYFTVCPSHFGGIIFCIQRRTGRTVYAHIAALLLPRMHAQGVRQSVCMSVVVIVIHMKIANLGNLGTWATCKANEYIRIGKKLASVYFESFCTGHKCHKYCTFNYACWPHLLITPRACARGKVISLVIVVVVVDTKIAKSGGLGTWASCKHNEYYPRTDLAI